MEAPRRNLRLARVPSYAEAVTIVAFSCILTLRILYQTAEQPLPFEPILAALPFPPPPSPVNIQFPRRMMPFDYSQHSPVRMEGECVEDVLIWTHQMCIRDGSASATYHNVTITQRTSDLSGELPLDHHPSPTQPQSLHRLHGRRCRDQLVGMVYILVPVALVVYTILTQLVSRCTYSNRPPAPPPYDPQSPFHLKTWSLFGIVIYRKEDLARKTVQVVAMEKELEITESQLARARERSVSDAEMQALEIEYQTLQAERRAMVNVLAHKQRREQEYKAERRRRQR